MKRVNSSSGSTRSRSSGEVNSASSTVTVNSGSTAPIRTIPSTAPALIVVKQAVEANLQDIQALETAASRALFGDVDVASYIEKGVAKSLFNAEHELVAFIAVQDQPNIAVFRHCNWQGWIRRYYRRFNFSSWNTLFIHHLVWDSRYPEFFINYLKHFYKNSVHLQQILFVVPPGLDLPEELAAHFTPLFPKDNHGVRSEDGQVIYLNLRLSVLNKLTVRRAGEEDNIDVQPILHCQHEILQRVFGHFQLGDVIDLQNTEKCVIVAEAGGVTVGVMSVTANVNYQHVHDFFFVPLPECAKVDDCSKSTMRQEQTCLGPTVPDDDLQSLIPEVFDSDDHDKESDEESDEESFGSYQREHSTSTVYLMDDEESEFRIVDPAMQYLLSKKHDDWDTLDSGSQVSLASSQSLDFNTYYGRPSWAYRYPRSPSDQSVLKDRETLKEIVLPPYTGPQDGFEITLYAFHPDLDVRYAFDLLEASFECYRDKTYCLLALPTFYQASPLTKHFVRLTPKLSRDFPHELYLAHRNSIFSEFSVRAASMADLEDICLLVRNISQSRKIRRDLLSLLAEDDLSSQGYVLECDDCIVGVAIISKNFVLQQMEPHYKVEEVIRLKQYGWEGHGLLRHAVVSVLFLRAGPYFLRQIMHRAGLVTLSCCLYPPECSLKVDTTAPTVLEALVPVRPRERIYYDRAALEGHAPEDFVLQHDQEFALFVTTEKLLSVPIQELNYRVVVVGASDTALSFLENLIFRSAQKHIRYNNLTLVSVHGLPLEMRPHNAGDRMIPHSGRYTRDYLSRLSLHTHVNVLYGVVSDIDRQEKMICLNDNHWLRYGYLFLFTGVQFCRPMVGDNQRKSDVSGATITPIPETAENLFLVNTTADSTIALGGLKRIIANRKTGKIIVYGNSINVFSCVEALLVFGVPGQKILIVECPDSCRNTGLDTNSTIEKTVLKSLRQAGVILHHGYHLFNWKLRHKFITSVVFRTDTHVPLHLECLALFCYGNKITSAKTYMALISAGIVYNGGIIINNQFRTNDEAIFAAGPGTKYSSRCRDSHADNDHYSSLEIGLQVSLMFRHLVEPWPEDRPVQEILATDNLPQPREPVTIVACLPGGWNYVRISAPGRPLPLECQLHGQGESGPVLITGDPVDPEGPGYFQLSLSAYNIVREIACLSKKEIPYQNLQRLYGLHEKLLNNMMKRYLSGMIPDLYAFFCQPWAYALFTSGFHSLVQQCSDIFQADEDAGLSVLQQLRNKHGSDDDIYSRLTDDELEQITQLYTSSSVPLYVEHLNLRYVSDYKLQLPMYLTDETLAAIQRTYASSPLHKIKYRQRHSASD